MPSRDRKKSPKERIRYSKMAVLSVLLLLANVFIWTTFRGHDRVFVTMASTLLALLGYICGSKALARIERHHGTIQGDGPAMVGKWANMVMFILAGMYFCYVFAMAVYGGRFL